MPWCLAHAAHGANVALSLDIYYGNSTTTHAGDQQVFTIIRKYGASQTKAAAMIAILLVYVYFASTLPVWILLQPRDYINAQQLVVGLLMLYGGLFALNPQLTAPAYNADATTSWFPLLFITIACGAISGFHGLVASGTSML